MQELLLELDLAQGSPGERVVLQDNLLNGNRDIEGLVVAVEDESARAPANDPPWSVPGLLEPREVVEGGRRGEGGHAGNWQAALTVANENLVTNARGADEMN